MSSGKTNQYIDYINKKVLSGINYARLQKDYQTESRFYTKSVLSGLHQGVLKVYETEHFEREEKGEGYVILPGILCSRETNNICIGLLELDLFSSGKLNGTDFLTKYGCINPEDEQMPGTIRRFLQEIYGAFDYGYAVFLKDDIYADRVHFSEDVRQILKDFRHYEFIPCAKQDVLQNICDYVEDDHSEEADKSLRVDGWER